MNRLSKKRAKQVRQYSKIRKKYLDEHPLCEAGMWGCNHFSNQIHHQKGKIGDLLTDVENFLAVCDPCHAQIEHEPILAKENGFSKMRLT